MPQKYAPDTEPGALIAVENVSIGLESPKRYNPLALA
jgi:hypothetical protein